MTTKKHTVTRGETIIEIAKKYNVTPYEIQQANLATLNSLDDIKENDVLIIPESKIKSPKLESAAEAIKATAAKQSLTYTVKKGDTKYGLAKRFGTSIAELEAQNPQIVAGLNEDHVLKINTSVENAPQESISKDKAHPDKKETLISFEGYKNHLVLKGETLWGISHANGLTVEQLVGENTDILTGILREGQILKVPQPKQEASPYETYLVKYGDTKYSLSKKYDTTIEELERLNPHIVRMLQAGHVIRIPSTESEPRNQETTETLVQTETPTQIHEETKLSDTTETVQKPQKEIDNIEETPALTEAENPKIPSSKTENDEPEPQASSVSHAEPYVAYEIQPKETLYGLSKKAGMSIEDFVALNPQLKESVQIGMIVKMPNTKAIPNAEKSTQSPSTPKDASRYKDLTKTIQTEKNEKLLYFLPFTEAQFNEEVDKSKNFSTVSDDFKKEHLEFYSGAKIAIDSIKNMGLNVEVNLMEAENNKRNSKLISLAKEQSLDTYDALIVPFYDSVGEELALEVAEQRIPVITTAAISNQQHVDNLFGALPSVNVQRKKMLDFMVAKQCNMIVVNDANRSESKDFIAAQVPSAQFVTIRNNGNFYDDDLIALLKPNQLNYIILDSNRNSVFLNVTNILLSELKNYNLQLAVLEPNLIPDTDDVSVKRYRILKMLFPSRTSLESDNLATDNFSKTYKKTFGVSPSTNAIFGFEITFDTLLRLAQGESFEASVKNEVTEYQKLKFDYKINATGGYQNQGIYILEYDTDSNIREAK